MERVEELLKRKLSADKDKGDCLTLAAGSKVHAEATRQDRIARAQAQKKLWAEKQGCIEYIHGDYTCTEDTESAGSGVRLEVAPEEPHDIPEDTESAGVDFQVFVRRLHDRITQPKVRLKRQILAVTLIHLYAKNQMISVSLIVSWLCR